MIKVAVSGATGFIGNAVLQSRPNIPIDFIGLSHSISNEKTIRYDPNNFNEIVKSLRGVDCLVHAAGYAHAHAGDLKRSNDLHWKINYCLSRTILDAAVKAGVGTFINLSTVKVFGDFHGESIDETCKENPMSAYAKSKFQFEKILNVYHERGDISIVNLRLSMVYGKGCSGNLNRMCEIVRRGFFPPIPQTYNKRSLIHIDDVVGAIHAVLADENSRGKTYIVTGPDAPSGRDIYNEIRMFYGYHPIQTQIPLFFFRVVALVLEGIQYLLQCRLPFNKEIFDRLFMSESYTCKKLTVDVKWTPEVSFKLGLKKTLS